MPLLALAGSCSSSLVPASVVCWEELVVAVNLVGGLKVIFFYLPQECLCVYCKWFGKIEKTLDQDFSRFFFCLLQCEVLILIFSSLYRDRYAYSFVTFYIPL